MHKVLLIFIATMLLVGCQPYRVTVEQGNLLSESMVAKLNLGMTRDEVAAMLGTPVLNDILHSDRWVYVYTKRVNGKVKATDRLTLEFKSNKLVRIR